MNGDNDSHHHDTQRLEAFSDAVFAIAITLLVLEIAVPHLEAGDDLARELWREWPSFFGFALSFTTIGITWMNHHGIFKDVDRFDHRLIVLNVLLLMGISFLPFPTAVLADYLQDDEHLRVATLFYASTSTVIAIIFNAFWLYASLGRRLIDEHVSDARILSRTRRYLPGMALYGDSIPLAFISPWLTLGLYVLLSLFFLLPLNE